MLPWFAVQKHGKRGRKFESPADAVLSNRAIGAEAPGATFGKTAFADFASVRYKDDGNEYGGMAR